MSKPFRSAPSATRVPTHDYLQVGILADRNNIEKSTRYAMACRRHPDMQQSCWSVLNVSIVRLVGWVITVPVLLGSLAHADLLYLDSRSGLSTGLGPVTVAVSPHPVWQPDNPANPGDAS